MKLNKQQLDQLATLFGLIAGIFTVFGKYQVVPDREAGIVSGISLALLGAIVQRPASSHPTTEDLEEHHE